MMSKEKRRVPKLRFPGFTEDWEQRKLGDFYTFKNGLNKEKVYFGYGDSIVNFTDVFHNRQIYSSTLKGKVFVNKKELENFKVKEGDLFFTRTSETIDEIGFPAVVMEPMERVVFSGFVLRGRAEKNDPLVNIFKSYIFFTDNFRSEMKKKSSMTTRALTSGTALKEMYFSYPKDLEEQTKIGEILLRLDNVITLHQRKLDNLKLKKKALLQKLFPKNGERYPELRFPGFTDAWEQRKLGEYANFRRGSFPQPYGNKEWYDGVGSAPFVQVVDVGDNLSLVECTKQRISKLAQPMSVYAEKGSVLVTLQGSIGRVAVSQYDAFIDRTILIFQGYKYKTNSYFWAYIIKNKFFEEALKAPGGTIKTITKEVLSNFIILYPKFSEQEQIGSFFEKLDKLITLHQRKLDHLQLQKKALLQQMFV
ncbi:MAG: restriction endonuclease subunit S [Veillonella sp.]|nr:restriction endonuclease subunit S [Veillonella sp.]